MPRSSSIRFVVAGQEHEAELRRLLRENPMDGEVSLSLEREPGFFLAASIKGDTHYTVAAIESDTGQIASFGSRSVRPVYMNGRVVRLGYLSLLRAVPQHRGRIKSMARGYRYMKGLRREDELPFDITTIMADNIVARRLLGRGIGGMPTYRELEPIETLTVSVGRRHRRTRGDPARVERAAPGHLDGIVSCLQRNYLRYQFAPHWTVDDLLSEERTRGLSLRDFFVALDGDDVRGCLAGWDQRGFKQVVVRGYSRRLSRLRLLSNMFAPLIGTPRLPAVGRPLRQCYISHIAVDDDNPQVFDALLTEAYNDCQRRRFHYLTLGFAERHPLLQVVRNRFRAIVSKSILYTVYWDDGETAASALDGRIPHIEVAVL